MNVDSAPEKPFLLNSFMRHYLFCVGISFFVLLKMCTEMLFAIASMVHNTTISIDKVFACQWYLRCDLLTYCEFSTTASRCNCMSKQFEIGIPYSMLCIHSIAAMTAQKIPLKHTSLRRRCRFVHFEFFWMHDYFSSALPFYSIGWFSHTHLPIVVLFISSGTIPLLVHFCRWCCHFSVHNPHKKK